MLGSGAISPEAPHPRQASGFPSALAAIKAVVFYLVSLTIAFPLFFIMIAISPFMAIFDRHRFAARKGSCTLDSHKTHTYVSLHSLGTLTRL